MTLINNVVDSLEMITTFTKLNEINNGVKSILWCPLIQPYIIGALSFSLLSLVCNQALAGCPVC